MERKPLTFGSLFAGIGGFDLGLERAGMVCKWQVEIDDFARRVLAKHWPDVPRHDDVRTFPTADRDWAVDVICGGFPCQDISAAGRKQGLDGERSGLWYEYARVIGELRPKYVIVENVAALLERGMEQILRDLAEVGYDAQWHCIPASAVGAPQERDRIWIIANAWGVGSARFITSEDIGSDGSWWSGSKKDLQSIACAPFERGDRWPQPLVRRMDDGFSGKSQRIHALGNAVVPQIPEMIGNAILESIGRRAIDRVKQP